MLKFLGILAVLLAPLPSLTESECGQRVAQSSRVVNGEEAIPHSWPWQISVRYKAGHICGGSLIENDLVLTAAHCVEFDPDPSEFLVTVGSHYRPIPFINTFRVKKVTYHSEYNGNNFRNDVALLQLEGSITPSDKVNRVCLPKSSYHQISPGTYCFITGWGRTIGEGNLADVLQQALLPVVDHATCRNKMGAVIKEEMLCAGGDGKGGCQGDSGGPLVCEENGKWVLRGVVSWGNAMCRTDHYTVFARVSNYLTWIAWGRETR